jgi:transcriptional regulator with XRE-family HTH domain
MPRVSPRNPETDPAALLGKHLRRVRIAAGYKIQDPFAAAAHISQDQISRAETGNQPPTDELFDVWMKLCGVTDPELEWFKDTFKLARNSKGLVVEGFEPWPGIERQASFTRSWCPMLVPGLLQVPEYALPLFYSMGKTKEKAAELLKLRLSRQDILTGPDPVTGVFIIDESVLFRLVGSPTLMVKQLDRMLALSTLPNVTIQVVRGAASLAGMFGAFDIASGDEIPDTMRIDAVQDQTTSDSALVREAIMIFELIRGRALNVEESHTVTMEARQQWKSQQ